VLTHHSQLEGVREGHQGDKRQGPCQNKTFDRETCRILGYLERQNHYCFN